jgi:hypothetical protein
MPRNPIVRLVDLCIRFAWPVIALILVLTALSSLYAVQHFAIATDIKTLFPRDLPWTQRARQELAMFPERGMLVVVDAPTPELAGQAAAQLTRALAADHRHFKRVEAPQSSPFFVREGFLYLPAGQLAAMAARLGRARPLVGAVAADPSLRGALGALDYGLLGAANGAVSLDALAPTLNRASATLADVLAGRPAHFSWQEAASGRPAATAELRQFIAVQPVLDYRALEPGRAATAAVAAAAATLDLTRGYQARVRVTGLVPMNDSQFAALQDRAGLNAAVMLGAVLVILWLALRSWRIILAVAVNLFCGLAMSAALGLFLVGRLNLISVAFFVLFVGLGVDFGIQFAVRYRNERHELGALRPALLAAATKAGGPLALAATATAIGFAAFVPTAYRGLSELGEIAGPGMLIAFLTSITLLPALIAVLNPAGERRAMGFAALAPVDRFVSRNRIPIVALTLGAVVLAAPLLYWLPFDFNPLHLQNPKAPAVATFLALRRDPQTGANAIDIVKPSLPAATATAQRLGHLPEVAATRTLASFVPPDQPQKLAMLKQMAAAIGPALNPQQPKAAPTDAQNVAAMRVTAGELAHAAAGNNAGAVAARRLAALLTRLVAATPAVRERADNAFAWPLKVALWHLGVALDPQPVTLATLPPELRRQWLAANGAARVQVLPQGDPDDTAALRRFDKAVLAVEPNATGPAITLYEAGNTILRAFIEAGIFALGGIFLLLLVTLRRLGDVLVTLVPLLLAAVVTLELCVVLDLPLNFANVIALPLLLGVGVAFKIYYVLAWRRGRTALVQSSLSRAVICSALTTGTAFGSLWLSSNPGTSSMGQLMGLALISTMAAAVLFQPALMGPARRAAAAAASPPAVAAAPATAALSGGWIVRRAGPPPQPSQPLAAPMETVSDDVRD